MSLWSVHRDRKWYDTLMGFGGLGFNDIDSLNKQGQKHTVGVEKCVSFDLTFISNSLAIFDYLMKTFINTQY